jgi:hypothetical protein
MRGGKHRFQVSEAKYDLLTSYFVPPEPSEGFKSHSDPRSRKLTSLQGVQWRRLYLSRRSQSLTQKWVAGGAS